MATSMPIIFDDTTSPFFVRVQRQVAGLIPRLPYDKFSPLSALIRWHRRVLAAFACRQVSGCRIFIASCKWRWRRDVLISGSRAKSHMPTHRWSETRLSFSVMKPLGDGLGKSASPDSIDSQTCQRTADGSDGSIVSGFLGFLGSSGLGKARHPRNGALGIGTWHQSLRRAGVAGREPGLVYGVH